jgi:hypothetical protein
VKPMTALLSSALLVLSVASCTTQTTKAPVPVGCTPPPVPGLPLIDRGELWDALGDAEYRVLERYIDRLWSHVDEQAAMLEVLCQPLLAESLARSGSAKTRLSASSSSAVSG